MDDEIVKEANRLKRVAGQKLENRLLRKFQELKDNNIIKGYQGKTNYSHTGYTYTHQYKTNFVLETLDDKRIIINSSNSFRDRVKQDLYDFEGIMKHADIADKIIASILLYPDDEFAENKTLQTFRYNAENKIAYCPATHILSFLELIEFLENHKAEVEREEVREEHSLRAYQSARSGSDFGKKGNQFEKDVVDLLNSLEQLELYQRGSNFVDPIYSSIIKKLMFDYDLDGELPTVVQATSTIKKLSNGSNAKTDVIVRVETNAYYLSETVSIKNTSQKSVSCHDYRAEDFIRVLEISDTKLAEYFHFYQQFGSHKSFDEGLPYDFSVEEFEQLLKPYAERLVEWALTGRHDVQRLIEPETQTSNYILINKPEAHRFTDYDSYIEDMNRKSKKVYGVPLGWTYPSKKRGERIQLKMPVII